MSRSSWKPPYLSKSNLRTSIILPSSIGKTYKIYNGHLFFYLKIKQNMVGKKFGCFYKTRTKKNV